MKTLLLLTTLFAFLQSAFLPVNLVLSLVAARAIIIDDKSNLYLAFFGGLILSFLMQVNLGYYPLLFILIVKMGALIKKLPVSFNLLTITVSAAVLIITAGALNAILIKEQFDLKLIFTEIVTTLLFYYSIKFWEERFSASTHTKLKLNSK